MIKGARLADAERFVIVGFETADCLRIKSVFGPVTMEEASKINGAISHGMVMPLRDVPTVVLTCIVEGCAETVEVSAVSSMRYHLCNKCFCALTPKLRNQWCTETSEGTRVPPVDLIRAINGHFV